MSGREHELRTPCKGCGGTAGVIEPRNGQDCVFCVWCSTYQYNAPRTETGREVRKLTRGPLKTKLKTAVWIRAGRRCELCGTPVEATNGLAIDHMLSVEDGKALGLSEAQLNNIENLAAMCEECNSGKGRTTLPLWLVVNILKARTRHLEAEGTPGDAA